MISEPKMVHKMWNILEEKGYKVGGEVKVVPQKRRKLERWYPIKDNEGEIIAWEEKESRQRLSVKEARHYIESGKLRPSLESSGEIVLKEKGSSETIDLVAGDSERFTGFEVKDTFKAVETCIASGQLEYYIKGIMLDEVYLVIPAHECEHVRGSYGSYLEETGVGLVTLDENYNLSNVSPSSTFQHSAKPHLKENEAWLKQMLWNYFEPKFDVEGEGILPKPLEEMPQSELVSTPKKFLKNIDLFLLPKGSSITVVASNQDKLESIGIEVKYEIKNKKDLESLIDKQLNPYAGSGALTRLYLATIRKDNMWFVEEIKRMENRKFGFLLYDNGEVKRILEAPKLQMQYDMFAYMPPTGEKVTIYEFGKPRPIKTIECSPYTNDKEFLRNELRFYRVIYARSSRRGAPHVIDVLDSPPSYLQ